PDDLAQRPADCSIGERLIIGACHFVKRAGAHFLILRRQRQVLQKRESRGRRKRFKPAILNGFAKPTKGCVLHTGVNSYEHPRCRSPDTYRNSPSPWLPRPPCRAAPVTATDWTPTVTRPHPAGAAPHR